MNSGLFNNFLGDIYLDTFIYIYIYIVCFQINIKSSFQKLVPDFRISYYSHYFILSKYAFWLIAMLEKESFFF